MSVPHARAVGSLGPEFVKWAESRSGRGLGSLAFGVGSSPDDGTDFAALLDIAERELARARHGAEAPGRTLRAA